MDRTIAGQAALGRLAEDFLGRLAKHGNMSETTQLAH